MIRIIFAALLCLVVLPAAATERRGHSNGGGLAQQQRQTAVAGAAAAAGASSVAATSSTSTATNAAAGGAGGAATAGGGSVTVRDQAQAPALGSLVAYPTAECLRIYGLGGSAQGGGGLLQIAVPDGHCRVLARAAMFDRLGNRAAALEAMCDVDDARAAMLRAGTPCAADRPQPQTFEQLASAALFPPTGRARSTEVFASLPACAVAPPGESTADRLTRETNCR